MWYRTMLCKAFRLTSTVLGCDQSAPFRLLLGLHDVFHYRKCHSLLFIVLLGSANNYAHRSWNRSACTLFENVPGLMNIAI